MEKQLLLTKRHEQSSQMPLRKSLRRKAICLKRFLLQTKVPYSRGKKSHRGYLLVKKRERGRKGEANGRVWERKRLAEATVPCKCSCVYSPSSIKPLIPEPWGKRATSAAHLLVIKQEGLDENPIQKKDWFHWHIP